MPSNVVGKLYKGSNITLIADGLHSGRLHALFFPELGAATNVVQVAPFGFLDFGKYNFSISVGDRRAVAADVTSELSSASPVASMMKKFIAEMKDLTITAVGFNYTFEVTFDGAAVDFVTQSFLKYERMLEIGGRLNAAGFKGLFDRGDHVLQTTVDPVWEHPNTLSVILNYHHGRPAESTWGTTVDRFSRFAAEVPAMLDLLFTSTVRVQ